MCDRVGAYCIRPSIIPNKNGQSFGNLWSMNPFLAGCLWGVCNTPLHGCTYLIDGWQGCFQVDAYCIRLSIISNENGQSFEDSWYRCSSLAEYLWGVCNTPLHGYTYLIDVWYRCTCVGAYCIRPPIGHTGAVESFWVLWYGCSFLAGCLWGVCFCALHGYAYFIDVWQGCFQVGAYCIRPSIFPDKNGQSFLDFRDIRSSLTGCL